MASVGLMLTGDRPASILLSGQLVIYAIAIVGWLMDRVGLRSVRPITWVYYFMLSVLASGLGVARAVRGERTRRFGSTWGRALG